MPLFELLCAHPHCKELSYACPIEAKAASKHSWASDYLASFVFHESILKKDKAMLGHGFPSMNLKMIRL